MEKIGNQQIWSYFDDSDSSARAATNNKIRGGAGHTVHSYFQLAKKVAELQFLNREYVLLFRGQATDYRTTKGNSTLKARIFRPEGHRVPTTGILTHRFAVLQAAERGLVERYSRDRFLGFDRLRRHRVLRWAILQHYEVCPTPLLDVTQSLRVAASFASREATAEHVYLFVFGVPNVSGAVTASSEAGLQIVRLSSACPPEAVRPHLQQGYLLGEYPDIADFGPDFKYQYYELDFGRRLVAKFRFKKNELWHSKHFPPASEEALYPTQPRDTLLSLTEELTASLNLMEA